MEWLEALNQNKIVPGLERIEKLMKLVGDPQKKARIIMVGGTNAKGSTCFNLNHNLTRAGLRVGCFTSPHLHSIRERIKIGNENIEVDELSEYLEYFKKISEKHGIKATYFETLTAIAYQYFYTKKVDWAIMEIGLGGEWDAVNIGDAEIAILTTLGIDHINYLGKKMEKIAITKAKIVREETTVITGWEKKYRFYIPNCKSLNYGKNIGDWVNLALTKMHLDMSLKLISIPGRLETKHNFTLDTAHNPQAIKFLMKQNINYQNIILGVLDDKDITSIVKLLPIQCKILACNINTEKGVHPSKITEICVDNSYNCKEFESVKKAMEYVNNEKTLVTGSFYTVAAAREFLKLEGHDEL